MFLAVVAIMLNSPNLFYMGTALVCTIAACRLQAWLSVRGLRFERVAPESVSVGDLVNVEITVWSEHRVRRPLITVWDNLPPGVPVSVAVTFCPVIPSHFHTPSLFENPKQEQLSRIMDQINERWGRDTAYFAAAQDARGHAPTRISFTRIPDLQEVDEV